MKKTCISKDWLFSMPESDGIKKIDLPHDFTVNQPRNPHSPGGAANGFFDGTKGSYVKYMKFENAEHTILDIDGAYMCARIYLNENLLDMHPYGYTPYLVDLTGRIRNGRSNKIGIDVLNVQPSTRWYSGSGIYRDVYLWTGGNVRIEPWDTFITTESIDDSCAEISVKFRISADFECDADVNVQIIDADGKCVESKLVNIKAAEGKNDNELKFKIKNPNLWSCETPYLYTLKTDISVNGASEDSSEITFGIRTISADSKNGLLLNGKPIKLKGGCIHHDHGVLGSAEFPDAVCRKLSKLKSVGYNAVRISHYPPSLVLLEICDKLGMLVMDEAFDMWNFPKNDLDYSLWFRDWWQRDISYMVLRDRNHPCVISYSIGNEIPERDGNSDGYLWSERLSAEIRKYDNTKLVTSGICGMWMNVDENAPDDYKQDFMQGYNDIGTGTVDSSWADKTEKYMQPLDIVGYNYLYERYAHDSEKYPERVIWGSETHALNFYDSWQEVLNHNNVIGDFTWTAYDNLGEAGTGRSAWGEDDFVNGISLADYPWRACYQGDFDLCGYRRPQSYFREAIWSGDTEPHIFTTHPKHNGDIFSGTQWHWYDVCETWTFDDEYIGTPIKTDVYSTADEIIFILNNKEVGRVKPVKGIATMYIPYEKGELTAVSVCNGKQEKTFTLATTGKAYKIRVVPESEQITPNNRDLCYFDIFIEDENGNIVTDADNEIECSLFGGELMGIFGGNPKNEDQYGSNKCHVFYGKAVAVARSRYAGELKIYIKSNGLKSGTSSVKVK